MIDCDALHKASSDSALVAGLAQQTGYWPVFTFLNSINNLIDLASVGIIGQKGTTFVAFVVNTS
jgi:RNA12 protein